ncbi:hypothetical protein BDN70DRAFT_925434 [Pholiota conissans]|uniref:Uncharacterized protein n=1 Tax=Pholiota conissans TaxID=109636 RepID=A0A9P5YPX1_9AGAR|nr:hypothetical protein BDN70DRAFT_925434 [Pholiota conissans]
MTTSTITSPTSPLTTTTPPTLANQEAHVPKPIALILGGVFGALALLVVLIAGIILLRRCMNEEARRRDRRPEVAASLWTTKPSKAPLTPFILQPSKQAYHALPRHAYGVDLQADYTSFLLSPPPPSAPSSNVPSTTSRPSTVYTAKHTYNASHAQGSSLSDPFATSSSRPSLSSPSPRPSTSPSPSSTPRPSTTSVSSTPSAIIDILPHLKAHLHLQAPRDHLPSSKAREAMLMHNHSHRRDGSAVSLATSSSTTSTLTTARMSANGTDTSRTSMNGGRQWEDEDTLPPGYVL